MGQESEELRADIEQRRESMSDTIDAIDAIEDRVVPGRIIERKRQAAREWTGGLRDRVMGSAHSVSDQAASAADRVSGGVSQAADKVSQAPEELQRANAGSPLIAGAVAFGVGALLAALLPETESERKAVQVVQPQLAAATDAIKDVGQQALETAQSSARDAAQELKSSATEHAHEVTEQAKDAGNSSRATPKRAVNSERPRRAPAADPERVGSPGRPEPASRRDRRTAVRRAAHARDLEVVGDPEVVGASPRATASLLRHLYPTPCEAGDNLRIPAG